MSDSKRAWYGIRSDLSVARFCGADARSFLQTKLACDTRRWVADGGGYGVATDINAKTLFDGWFFVDDAAIGVVWAADNAQSAQEHLGRYVIMDDIEMGSTEGGVVAVGGSDAARLLGVEPIEDRSRSRPLGGFPGAQVFWAPNPAGVAGQWFVVVPRESLAALESKLGDLGLGRRCAEEMVAAEIEGGVPAIGRDFFVGRTIPLEAGLYNGLSLSKGCYLGQEVLERIFSLGNVARRLMRVRWEGAVVDPGTALVAEGAAVGEITSCVSVQGGAVGMAYLRRKALEAAWPISLGEMGSSVTLEGPVGGPTPDAP